MITSKNKISYFGFNFNRKSTLYFNLFGVRFTDMHLSISNNSKPTDSDIDKYRALHCHLKFMHQIVWIVCNSIYSLVEFELSQKPFCFMNYGLH